MIDFSAIWVQPANRALANHVCLFEHHMVSISFCNVKHITDEKNKHFSQLPLQDLKRVHLHVTLQMKNQTFIRTATSRSKHVKLDVTLQMKNQAFLTTATSRSKACEV